MIQGERVSVEPKSISLQASGHQPMTLKPIAKEPKISEMTLADITKAIQESLRDNRAPQNNHMYPSREWEQQWCS
ncbi:hypothetical protein, partial [Enterobacter cloacae complex sp. CH23B]|uniref:hypothetical protein n=1 Tax=Enterobacter cloacae complex sp. CH23B TaxID=2511986 RepID=UPI001CA4CE5C